MGKLVRYFSLDMNVEIITNVIYFCVDPFVSNAPFLYPLKTSENLTIFQFFQGIEKRCIENEWIKVFHTTALFLYPLKTLKTGGFLA